MSAKKKSMKYVRLGDTGLWVSQLCMGMMSFGDPSINRPDWALTQEEAKPFVKRALDAGINFFDTADCYSLGASEVVLGNLLRELKVPREEVVIATKGHRSFKIDKFGATGVANDNSGGLGRKHIMQACEDSLRRLKMDYIDLYIIHRADANVPIEETMCALNDLVRSGKVRYIGASSMYTWQFQQANHIAEKNGWAKFISMQNFYNLLYREEEREMIPYCRASGIALTPWSPLGRGVLGGKFSKNVVVENLPKRSQSVHKRVADNKWLKESDWKIVERCKKLGKELGVTPAQIALAWIVRKPGVTSPVFGATKMYQLEEALGSLNVELSVEQMKYLEEPYEPHEMQGNLVEPIFSKL